MNWKFWRKEELVDNTEQKQKLIDSYNFLLKNLGQTFHPDSEQKRVMREEFKFALKKVKK